MRVFTSCCLLLVIALLLSAQAVFPPNNALASFNLANNVPLTWLNTSGTAVQVLQYTNGNHTVIGANQEIDLAGTITLSSPSPGNTRIIGGAADSATAIGVRFDTTNTFSTTGAKLAMFRNAGTEKASITYDGSFLGAGLTAFGAAGGTGLGIGNTAPNLEIAGPVRSSRPAVQTQYVELVGNLTGNSIGLHAFGSNKTLNIINESSGTLANVGIQFFQGTTASMAGMGGFDASNNWYIIGTSSVGGASVTGPANYVPTESGTGANHIAATLTTTTLGNEQLVDGQCLTLQLAHTLQAGANDFAYNGGSAVAIKSHFNPANNIATAYAATGRITLCYNTTGPAWLDMAQ